MKIKSNRKGFTLIELLVVIAIIAVLAVVVILSLNPAELLRQARDSNRVSDMATLKSAISLYLADVSSPTLVSAAPPTTGCLANSYNCIYGSQAGIAPSGTVYTGFLIGGGASTTGTSTRTVNGLGWVPVTFTNISSGAPIGSLPVDPVNSVSSFATIGNGALVYLYGATSSNLGFKITAHMESTKFSTNGAGDVETGDGGNSTTTYEQGTNVTL